MGWKSEGCSAGGAHLARQFHAALAALGKHLAEGKIRAIFLAILLDICEFRIRVRVKAVDRHDHGHAVLAHILDMRAQVDDPLLQGFQVFVPGLRLGAPPLYLSARAVATTTTAFGRSPAKRHLMSKNFLRAEVGTKPRLSDAIIRQFQRQACRAHGIASMGNVRKTDRRA